MLRISNCTHRPALEERMPTALICGDHQSKKSVVAHIH